ncbi:MAG TPA: asparagine synthase-related protein [Pyrinomonadaceae bacterium]
MNQDKLQNLRTEVLHWDGRLDNREDLLLRFRDSLQIDTSNQAIARAAYERWGTKGLVHLIGDWSLVLRDNVNRTTILASDFAGVRPLYYHVRGERVLWSNRLQSLVEATGISDLDEQYIAGFLTVGGFPNRTPYKEIYSTPPGHAVCVSSKGLSINKFWELPVGDVIQYKDERRYEEQLLALFREAVAVRLQTESPVLAELSGGLDSSSVVCMANQLVRSGEVSAPSITGLSFSWPNSLDGTFIKEVESHCGIEGIHISTHDVPLVTETQAGHTMPQPFEPLRKFVAAAAQQSNAKTILTGQNGDLVFGNWFDDSLQVAASVRRLRLGRASEEALAWSKILRRPIYGILWRAAQAALPHAWSPTALYTTGDGSYAPKSAETSLLSGFSERTDLSNPTSFFSRDWLRSSPERRKHFYNLTMALELRNLQAPEQLQHLDYTHPFAHRPLVEFLMTAPADILCRPGEPRRLMRSTFAGLWPKKVSERRSKGSFSAPWKEAMRPIARLLLQTKRLQVVDRNFVDQTNLRSRLQRLCSGLDCNEYQLRQIMLLELWLRNRAAAELSRPELRAA